MDPHKDSNTDEFMLIGHFKEDYLRQCIENHEIAWRTNNNVVPDYLLYECDSLPLEEQLNIINNLDHSCIRYITFSGSKSYHVLFKIKVPNDITNEEYKEVWKDVMDFYEVREHADPACANKSRLTRNPNGYRRKYIKDIFGNESATPTRIKQTCIYDNPNCESIDLIKNVESIRKQAILDEEYREKQRERTKNALEKLGFNKNPEEVISHIKKECEAKAGYDMWQGGNFPAGYNYLGCARGMYNICMQAGCDETETIEFCRRFLIAVSEAHPTNISKHKATEWKPPVTYRT